MEKQKLKKYYSPSWDNNSDYDETQALPSETMQAESLNNLIRNLIADKKPPSEFEEGGGGIAESALSPIDLISPSMVTSPMKALGRGAMSLGKAGLEVGEAGAKSFAERYPELVKRLKDRTGSIESGGWGSEVKPGMKSTPSRLEGALEVRQQQPGLAKRYGPMSKESLPDDMSESLSDLYNKGKEIKGSSLPTKTRGTTGDSTKDRIIEILRNEIRRDELKDLPREALGNDEFLIKEADRILSMPPDELGAWMKKQTQKEAEDLRRIRSSMADPNARFGGPVTAEEIESGAIESGAISSEHPEFERIRKLTRKR